MQDSKDFDDINGVRNIDSKLIYFDIDNAKKLENIESNTQEYPLFSNKIDGFIFSATKLNDYKDCTRRFFFKYIEHLQMESDNVNTSVGNIIHLFLKQSYEPFINKDLNEDSMRKIRESFFNFYDEFSKNFLKNIESKQDSKNNMEIENFIKLDNFCLKINTFFDNEIKRVNTDKISLLALEYPFTIIKNDEICSGKIDRIEKINDKIAIIDYKTGSIPLTKSDNLDEKSKAKIDLQMPFYAMCADFIDVLSEFKDLDKTFYYADLKEKQNLVIMQENLLDEGTKEINDIFKNFGNKNQMCEDINKCKYCDYKIICDRG
nr:PD-(D/E)XK nuclease family protein [Helicobacter saguini]